MNSQHFNRGGNGFYSDLNLPSAPVPSSSLPGPQPPLPNTFGVTGRAGDPDPEWSDMAFQSLSPSIIHPRESMVTRRSNDEGGVGYAEAENRSLPLKQGEEAEARSHCAAEKTKHTKICTRGHWRPAEDAKLEELVAQFGPQNWNMVAQHIEGRSGKSCRLRWFNQLDPRINKRAFTAEEEERVLAAHRLYGNKWAMISRLFPGRTDNAVKNHWHVIMARRQREQSSGGYGRRKPTLNQSIPNGLALTISNNATNIGSTISSNIDESASTYTNLTCTPSSARPIPMPFNNPIPVPNHHANGNRSIIGLSGERMVKTGNFGIDKFLGAWNCLYEPGPMEKPVGVLDKTNYSNSNSEVSASESVATNQSNMMSISIPRETENMHAEAKMSFIDFLGVGDT